MSGLTKPKVVKSDPTNPAVNPLIQQLAGQLGSGGFDAAMWEGPYGAPLTNLQLDSMGAIEQLLNANPIAQTSDIQSMLTQAMGGGAPALPTTDTSGIMQTFGDIFNNAGAATAGLAPTNYGGVQATLQDLIGQAGSFGNVGMTDLSSVISDLSRVASSAGTRELPTTDLSTITGMAESLYGNVPGAAQPATNLITQGTQASPELQALFGTALPAFQSMLNSPSFDTTEMFNNARNVYEADLENALAGAREEFSGLGLDPGSSTRAAGLARVGATEAARFNTAQQEVARQSFENAQNRSLQALGYAPALSEAFARPQDRMIQAGSVLGQLGLDTARTQADILPTLGNLAQVPFAEALAGGQLDLQGMGLGTDALTRIADMMKTPFEQGLANEQLGLSGTNLAASLMPTLAELTGKPLQEMMGIAGLGLEGTGIQASTLPAFTSASQIPFEQALAQYGAGLQGQQTGISALPAFMDLFNNPARLAESAFNMGETARGAEQGTIDRMLMEYGRTQNAMLPFMLQLISGTPRMDIGYGPSTLSQLGSFAQGVGSLIPGIGK